MHALVFVYNNVVKQTSWTTRYVNIRNAPHPHLLGLLEYCTLFLQDNYDGHEMNYMVC